jgi:Serine carboxypeptidase S28
MAGSNGNSNGYPSGIKTNNGYGSISQKEELEVDQTRALELNGHSASQRRKHVALAAIVGVPLLAAAAYFGYHHRLEKLAPKTPVYFHGTLIDHHNPDRGTYSLKYFEQRKHFRGPGNPIFVVLGGEDPMIDLLYPFIYENLGSLYGAYSMGVEHRFFGDSWPVPYESHTNQDLIQLLTPEQFALDIVQLIQHKQSELGCGPRGKPDYCPVMVVGGSYPGLMATVLRLNFGDVVDIAYAGSAPLYLYSHGVDSNAYYDKVTSVADEASPGCASAVRSTLLDVQSYLSHTSDSIDAAATKLGICPGTVPEYIGKHKLFAQELEMVVVTHFADDNMGYYPPVETNELPRACKIFQDDTATSLERVGNFLRMRKGSEKCFDLMTELPPGPDGHISASDWSGVADGPAGWMWDFLSCELIPMCGWGEDSMFPDRPWTLEWFTSHCERRFDYTPSPPALDEQFHFTNLTGASHLLFTNGLNDGWSIASVLAKPPHSEVEVINYPNGAHHSDLRVAGPQPYDTPDIKEGHARITELIGTWLNEIRAENGNAADE